MSILPFLLAIGTMIALISWVAGFGTQRLAKRYGVLDHPKGGRKIHKSPIPLLGGVGIGLTIISSVLIGLRLGWFPASDIRAAQLYGFIAALFILLAVGYLDERHDLPPIARLAALIAAALCVILSGTGIVQITNWSGQGGMSMVWWKFGAISLPADLLTLAWLVAVTLAVKFLDGLDGLVTGQTVIASGLIAALALSAAYFQPPVAILAMIIAAAFFGFLPHNVHPAKQFLGESGSTVAGFSLAFLAIVSGAKMATALMALGLPLADASLVILGRMARGASPFRGDDTHLHFKLLQAGLSQRQVVAVMWVIALVFGVAAFGFQTRGKTLLLIALVGTTILLSFFAGIMRRKRSPEV